jgi:hypothetical protein
MSDYRFDVLERFERLVKAPEPSFEGFLRRRDRKRRNQRIAAGVVAIAIFVTPVALMVATGEWSGRTQTPADTSPTVQPDPPDPIGVGLFGLPPKGATPSAPERGELVLGLGFGHTDGDAGRFSLHVYADGRVIWQRLSNPQTGLIEQRLTPVGVELVRNEALSTGFFEHDRVLLGAGGLHYGGIEVRDGGRLVQLAWGDAGFEEGIDSVATTPTPEQVRTLERLDARLEDLTSWLPASAWDDPEFKAYVPSRYQVCYMYVSDGEPIGRLRVLEVLPAPVEDLLRTVETTQSYPNGFRDSNPFWCSVVSIEQARELAAVMEDAGGLSYASADGNVDIELGPALPHE